MQVSHRNYRNYYYYRNTRMTVVKSKRRLPRKAAALTAGLLIVAVSAFSFWPNDGKNTQRAVAQVNPNHSSQAPVDSKNEAAKEKVLSKKVVNISELEPQLAQITAKYPYNTSVSVIELNSGKQVQTGDTYPFIAASTTKLVTAMAYLHDVEQGKATLKQNIGGAPAEKQLQLMINRSDNPAWEKINLYLKYSRLEAYAKEHGLSSFDARKNMITSNDMSKLMAKLYKRELLNEEHTQLLLSWMQNTSEERFIPAAIPASSKIYHKAGYLVDRVHDVAVIDNDSTPFILVIYSKANGPTYDYAKGQKLYKEITSLALDTFK